MSDLKFKLFLFTKQFDKLVNLDKKQVKIIIESELSLEDKIRVLRNNDCLFLLNNLSDVEINNILKLNIALNDKILLCYVNDYEKYFKLFSKEDKNDFFKGLNHLYILQSNNDNESDAIGLFSLFSLTDVDSYNIGINTYNRALYLIVNYCINNIAEVYKLMNSKDYLKVIEKAFSSYCIKYDSTNEVTYNKYLTFLKELPRLEEAMLKNVHVASKQTGEKLIQDLIKEDKFRKIIISDDFLNNNSNEKKCDLQNSFTNNINNFYCLRDEELWALAYIPINEYDSIYRKEDSIAKVLRFYFKDVDETTFDKVVEIWVNLDAASNKYIISLLKNNNINDFLSKFYFLVNNYFSDDNKSFIRSCSLIRNYSSLVSSLVNKEVSDVDMQLVKRLSKLPKLSNQINNIDDIRMALDNIDIGVTDRHGKIGISPVGYSNDAFFSNRRELTYIFPNGEILERDALFSHSATAFSDMKKYGLLDSKWIDNNKSKIFNPAPLIASLGNIVIISESANEYVYLPLNTNTKQIEELFLIYKELNEKQLGELRIGIAVVTDSYSKKNIVEDNIRDINYFMYNEGDLLRFDEFVYFLENVYKSGLKKNR